MAHRPTIQESFDDATQRLAHVVNDNAHLLAQAIPPDPDDPVHQALQKILNARKVYEARRRILMEDLL